MSNENEIRPFRVDMSGEAIADLRRRIAAARLPSPELVTDQSQGVQLATIQGLPGEKAQQPAMPLMVAGRWSLRAPARIKDW